MVTIVGVLLGTMLIALGILKGQAPAEVFLNWQGLAIVIGGTFAATLISYPLPEVIRGFRSYFVIFRTGSYNFVQAIDRMVAAVRILHREGIDALAREVSSWRALWILKDGVQMMLNGYTREETRAVLEDQIRWQLAREHKQHELFGRMAKIAPAFGMIGTLIGLINMLITLQTQPKHVGAGLAVALTTTFYGLILANLFFAPISAKIKERADNNLLLETLQIEAVLMLYEKRNYVFVRDKLAAYLNASKRSKLIQSAGQHYAKTTRKPVHRAA